MNPIKQTEFGKMPDGRTVYQYELRNDQGMIVKLINYGATVKELHVPDKNSETADVVLGFDDLDGYLSSDNPFFGATIGRYGNRIANAAFTIEGNKYKLTANENNNTLHGGKGFDKRYWEAQPLDGDEPSIRFSYLSPHLEEGFPGNLKVEVVFTLSQDNQLKIDYQAVTDKTTHVNLTHHSYFNLNGAQKDILDHHLWVKAEAMTEVDDQLIPTGKIRNIENTPFDFTGMIRLKDRIEDIPGGIGLDNNFVLDKEAGKLEKVSRAWDPESGRYIEAYTTEPGLQIFTSGPLGPIKGKYGIGYGPYYGLCMEPQHFPDSPNKPEFLSTLLKPGEQYQSSTIYKFGVE